MQGGLRRRVRCELRRCTADLRDRAALGVGRDVLLPRAAGTGQRTPKEGAQDVGAGATAPAVCGGRATPSRPGIGRRSRRAFLIGAMEDWRESQPMGDRAVAQKVTVVLTDDIDSSEAVETVSFGLDGGHYEIDLSEDHTKSLRDALSPYVSAGRRAGGGRPRASTAMRPPAAVRTNSTDNSAVRAWAKEQGFEVSERGRISSSVRVAYDAAH